MITIEMIDKVMESTGKDYGEIKAELENNGGDVEAAIRALGGKKDKSSYSYKGKELNITPEDVMSTIKEIWQSGSASNLIIEKDGKQVFKFNLLISGALAIVAIWPVLLGLGVAIIADYNIKIQMDDGREVNINEVTLEKKFNEVFDKSSKEKKEDFEVKKDPVDVTSAVDADYTEVKPE